MQAIEWRRATKRYSQRTALDSLVLSIPRGVCLGLLGPNGAGKTTALRLALGYARPSDGAVSLQGRSPLDPRSREGLGVLPERLILPGATRVFDLMKLHAALIRLTGARADAAIEAALEGTGVADRSHERLGGLSKGLRQRVGFAIALLGDPQLLVLDEPSTGLDPLGVRDARGWIEAARARGCTVLVSSHQLSEVERTCDRVAILDHGRLITEGETDEIVGGDETLEDAFVRVLGR